MVLVVLLLLLLVVVVVVVLPVGVPVNGGTSGLEELVQCRRRVTRGRRVLASVHCRRVRQSDGGTVLLLLNVHVGCRFGGNRCCDRTPHHGSLRILRVTGVAGFRAEAVSVWVAETRLQVVCESSGDRFVSLDAGFA